MNKKKNRLCLYCDEMFMSWGPANRLCKPCLKGAGTSGKKGRYSGIPKREVRGLKPVKMGEWKQVPKEEW